MIFVETSIFTNEIECLLPDESYRKLQSVLMLRSKAGSVIRGSGGLRETEQEDLTPDQLKLLRKMAKEFLV